MSELSFIFKDASSCEVRDNTILLGHICRNKKGNWGLSGYSFISYSNLKKITKKIKELNNDRIADSCGVHVINLFDDLEVE